MNPTVLRSSLGPGAGCQLGLSGPPTMSQDVIELVPGGSQRGGHVLFRNDFKFVFQKTLAGGGCRWLCSERKKSRCKAYVNTWGSEVKKCHEEHTHPANNKMKQVCLQRTSKMKTEDLFSHSQEFIGHPADSDETHQLQPNPSEYNSKWLPGESGQDSREDSQCLNEIADFSEAPLCIPELTEGPPETTQSRTSLKRKAAAHSSTSKHSKHALAQDSQMDFMFGAVEHDKLDDVSFRASHSTREDSYDFFGKYVASMLRDIGPPSAMRLQSMITNLVTDAMCSQPSSEHYGQPISGKQTNVNNEQIPCESTVTIKSEEDDASYNI
ncbi:hypothetical protein GE061_001896 [Apolygus lucorum]|uniref:Uncharacterized protein n=1 Tax=Apolygus lucorum TaxID=248454 RepID=A0A6A4IWS3_APOLU|nr:hypothetical protein GE061_001896 [Apolygus lucorum]